ncbi:MAG: hypothetical protein ABR992_06570 [Solirubrobacteraceae bacterium]|jgi:hypothetical protein
MTFAVLSTVVPLALIGVIAFLLFSKRGRDTFVRVAFGAVIGEQELGATEIHHATQTLRVLKCRQGTETFYVLEAMFRRPLAARTTYTKLDRDALSKLSSFTHE